MTLLSNYAKNYGESDMLKVGNVFVTSSWDELGIRTRKMIDYRPQAIAEYRRYPATCGSATRGRTAIRMATAAPTTASPVRPRRIGSRSCRRCSRSFYDSLPPAADKWQHTGAYKLWIDFHRYFTFEFFRRVSDAATRRDGGRRIECYPFPIAFIMWPGMNCFMGLSCYWNARLNPIITVEQCWPDAPPMPLAYAQGDRLARQFHNLVMGWSWFFFGDEAQDMYDGEGDIERALARMMGHTADGIHHWLYSPLYRSRHPEAAPAAGVLA